MAAKIIRQFMATNRHKLPSSLEELKTYITGLWTDLGRTPDPEQVDHLAHEFIAEPQKPPENPPQTTSAGKSTQKRKQ